MGVVFEAMPTAYARHIWDVGPNTYDLHPETAISDGNGVPCRHCLRPVDSDVAIFAKKSS